MKNEKILENDEFIAIQNEIAAPYYDHLVETFMEGCEYRPPPDTPLKKALPEPEAREGLRKELRRAAADEGERRRASRGLELIYDEIRAQSGGEVYYQELMKAGETLRSQLIAPIIQALAEHKKEDAVSLQSQEPQAVEKEEQQEQKTEGSFWKDFVPLAGTLGISFEALTAIYHIGNSLFEKGNYEDAAAVYEVLTVFDSRLEEAWYAAGLAHYRRMSWHDAISNFTMATAVNPNHPIYYLDLAYSYLKIHDLEEAKRMLKFAEERLEGASMDNAKQQQFRSSIKHLWANLGNL